MKEQKGRWKQASVKGTCRLSIFMRLIIIHHCSTKYHQMHHYFYKDGNLHFELFTKLINLSQLNFLGSKFLYMFQKTGRKRCRMNVLANGHSLIAPGNILYIISNYYAAVVLYLFWLGKISEFHKFIENILSMECIL